MEERVKTSFIPKTSLQTPEARHTSGNPVALANLVCGVLLVLSIVGAGAMYAFLQYTNSQITAKEQSLSLSSQAFEPSTIEELSRLDTRIQVAEGLLTTHLAPSKLFDDLENLTLASVTYNNFNYSVVSPGNVVLTMSGEAANFNSVALQSDSFAKSSIITDPIFSNVNVDSQGTVTFDFTGIINTANMLYDASIGAATSTTPVILNTASTTTP